LRRCAAAVLLGLGWTGCALFAQEPPPKQRFVLEARREGSAAPATGAPALEVRPLAPSPRLDGKQLVYRTGENAYVADFYAELWSSPGALVGDVTADWLAGSGLFSQVLRPGGSRRAPLVLEGWIADLHGDYRDPAAPRAVLELRFALLERRSPDPLVRAERRYREEAAIASASPDALVAGWNQCLAQVLAALERDLAAAR
jgi:cholesterol transport system auxiliary component